MLKLREGVQVLNIYPEVSNTPASAKTPTNEPTGSNTDATMQVRVRDTSGRTDESNGTGDCTHKWR